MRRASPAVRPCFAVFLAAIWMLALHAGCTSTRLVQSWRDLHATPPAGGYDRILIVCIASPSEIRQAAEDQFSEQLRAHGARSGVDSDGVQGLPSYRFIPPDQPIDENRINEAVRRSRAQAVLVTRLAMRSRRSTTYRDVPPGYVARRGGYRGFYGNPAYYGFNEAAWAGGRPHSASTSTYAYDVFVLENQLFDVGAVALVWAAATRTEDPISPKREISRLTHLIARELAREGLI